MAMSLVLWKINNIARAVKRNRCAVLKYFKNVKYHGEKRKSSVMRPKTSPWEIQLICKEASKGFQNVKRIRYKLKIDFSPKVV